MRLISKMIATTAAASVLAFGSATARDLAAMKPEEIRLLQQRLTDARCYSGPIDGLGSPATETAKKACPDQEPELRIETGMHTAAIRRVAVDAACTVIATASDDKTVRLWSLPDGRLKQTLRLPIADGKGGTAYAAALSDDGRWLAVGGWDARWDISDTMAIYLIDLTTGSVRRIGAFESVIAHLAFSPDGRRIAVALGSGKGIRVHDVVSGNELMADRDFGSNSPGIVFTADGGLAATGYDGFLRRYGPDLKRTQKVKAPDGSRPYSIAISPDGRFLGVGNSDSTAVSIVDGLTLKPVAKTETGDVTNGDLSSVAWSRDGRLWAGGRANLPGSVRNFVRAFTPDGRKAGADTGVSDATVFDIKTCGDAIAFGTSDPNFGLVAPSGKVTQLQGPVTADMRAKLGNALAVSSDGTMVRFGLSYGARDAILFDLAAARLSEATQTQLALTPPKLTGLEVTNWEDKTDPALKGKPLAMEEYETSHALAVRQGADGFVLGTEWKIRAFDASGGLRWKKSTPGAAWGVSLARDGALVIAAHDDGTIRWYRWSDGQELLALFVHKLDKRWVAWTPTGYYMASPGAEDLIGWHMNRGWDQAPDFFPASRFRDRFSRPDIVQKILTTLDEGEAVRRANAEAGRKETVKPIEAQLPPVIRITNPKDGASFGATSVTLDIDLRSPSGLAVTAIDILIDGRPLADARGAGRSNAIETGVAACLTSVTRGLSRVEPTPCRLTLPPPQKAMEVSVVARAGDLASVPATVKLAYAGARQDDDLLKPKLYVLAVGVADYAEPDLKLDFAGRDAVVFADTLKKQQGGIYREVVTRVLVDREATRVDIMDGLDWLEKEVTSRDVAVVFMAGHGETDEAGAFWFLPADVRKAKLKATSLSQDDLRRTVQKLPGKVLLFLDACHAGKASGTVASARGSADVNAIVNLISSTEGGVVTFASSTGREVSLEHPDWGHGAFTKALIEGIGEGKANLMNSGSITLSELDAFVAERVKQLTGGRQHPVMTRPATITNFAVAIVR